MEKPGPLWVEIRHAALAPSKNPLLGFLRAATEPATSHLQAALTRGAKPAFTAVPQPSGWQCLLHAALHQGDVISLTLAAAPRILASGDARGHVVVLDLAKVSSWTLFPRQHAPALNHYDSILVA